MGWNRPNEVGRVAPRPPQRKGLVGGLVAGAVIVLCAVGTWWFLSDSDGRGAMRQADSRRGLIKEATPAADGHAAADGGLAVTNAPERGAPAAGSADAPSVRPPAPRPANVITNDGSHLPPDRYAVLPLNCDKQIAGLLYAVPGQLMIGSVDFGEQFEQQFKESLKTKLVPAEDATDEEREMIEAVNQAKEAIVRAMKEEGSTAGEILAETRRQMRELGRYKMMLKEEISRYENDENKTDEDVSDLFDAANRMLKENGIEPFEPNDLTREVVRQHKFDQLERGEKPETEPTDGGTNAQ